MAEFREVMKQITRMANACEGKCDKCPLYDSAICNAPWCFRSTEGIAEAERIVMQWAAEHPEPVYPTWLEWLKSMGVIPYMMSMVVSRDDEGNFIHGHVDIKENALKPIPADIAEKLGIEPEK